MYVWNWPKVDGWFVYKHKPTQCLNRFDNGLSSASRRLVGSSVPSKMTDGGNPHELTKALHQGSWKAITYLSHLADARTAKVRPPGTCHTSILLTSKAVVAGNMSRLAAARDSVRFTGGLQMKRLLRVLGRLSAVVVCWLRWMLTPSISIYPLSFLIYDWS